MGAQKNYVEQVHPLRQEAVVTAVQCREPIFPPHYGAGAVQHRDGQLADLASSRSELQAENALLRQQLIVMHRQVKTHGLRGAIGCRCYRCERGALGPGLDANPVDHPAGDPLSLAPAPACLASVARASACFGGSRRVGRNQPSAWAPRRSR